MSNDIGETIIDPNTVDLRLPQAPQPIWFSALGNTDMLRQISRYFGEGEINHSFDSSPKYCIFVASSITGKISNFDFYYGIEPCFRTHGTEACVFQYCPIGQHFIGRAHEWFVEARVEKNNI